MAQWQCPSLPNCKPCLRQGKPTLNFANEDSCIQCGCSKPVDEFAAKMEALYKQYPDRRPKGKGKGKDSGKASGGKTGKGGKAGGKGGANDSAKSKGKGAGKGGVWGKGNHAPAQAPAQAAPPAPDTGLFSKSQRRRLRKKEAESVVQDSKSSRHVRGTFVSYCGL